MDNIKIIQISDIHFNTNNLDDNLLVLNAFFEDLNIYVWNKDTTYCVISGDLVSTGSRKEYDAFYEYFIKKILNYTRLENIIVVPGNHDLNRSVVEETYSKYSLLFEDNYAEKDFNEYLRAEEKCFFIKEKFKAYIDFCRNKLFKGDFDYCGFSELLTPEISVYCLNSALLSLGGYSNQNDLGRLKIETSAINEWISSNSGRTKILLMHHPITYLAESYQKEIQAMLRKRDIDYVISGHIHDQNILTQDDCNIIHSPQLFSSKQDVNGYAICDFENGKMSQIAYREWVGRQRKFMPGHSFSGTDDGIVSLKKDIVGEDDYIYNLLNQDFKESMRSYATIPIWSQRYLTTLAPNDISRDKEKKYDYLDIINGIQNCQIIAPPQFGLTCFARYLSLKAWEIKKSFWLYLDSSIFRLSNVEKDLLFSVEKYKVQIDSVQCLVLDNWRSTIKDSDKILSKIRKIFPQKPIVILSNYDDSIIINGIDTDESHVGFKQLYLKELDKKSIRAIVKKFNEDNYIGDENVVLNRVCLDISDLNVHRTPINCLQLLLSFKKNFSDRPINRSQIFSYILALIFDNPQRFVYGDQLDEESCKFILGAFCENLLKRAEFSFSEKEFIDFSSNFAINNYDTTNVVNLLEILKENQIIVYRRNCLEFRFTCWVYYFAAERMKLNTDFMEYMFSEKHSSYIPDLIEFYTGTDYARIDAVKKIIEDLKNLTALVHVKIGLKDSFNPLENLRWHQNESSQNLTKTELENNIRKSQLPEEIKDSLSDLSYDSAKPYNQTIYKYMEDYELKNLMDLTRSASRALRNSRLISPEKKEELSICIYDAWHEIIRGLFLIAPIMAKNGFGGVGGANFKLSENFPKDYSECLIKILTCMPYNLVLWYKDEIYSDKLLSLFEKYMLEYKDPVIRHTIAVLLCFCRPKDWDFYVMKYIDSIHKNSYYLGDLYVNLQNNYSCHYMTSKELGQTEKLIKACWAKHNIGSKALGVKSISKVSDKVLPVRDVFLTEE